MESSDQSDFDRGPFITPQMVVLFLFLIGGPALFFVFSRDLPEEPPNYYGLYENKKEEGQNNMPELPNRKPEVDKAVENVDFETHDYQIVLDTTLGTIRLDLWPDVAPGHCKNMIGLTRIGFYDGLIFHRVISEFMAQGGCPLGNGSGGPGYTIAPEFNDREHVAGVLSMARRQAPSTAGSQFFICTGRAPHLDNKYTAFGKVADEESLGVVLKFNDVQTEARDKPLENIKINSAEVVEIPK